MDKQRYRDILIRELVPAMGCTEPIAVALTAAYAAETLGCFPESISVACSGNVIKNAQGVVVPHSGNLKGIRAAAILGALVGDPQPGLEVLSHTTRQQTARAKELLSSPLCTVSQLDTPEPLHIVVEMSSGAEQVSVELKHHHTHISRVVKNGRVVVDNDHGGSGAGEDDYSQVCMADIFAYAQQEELEELKKLLQEQIDFNMQIATEGLDKAYGARVGANLLKTHRQDVETMAKAYAAAGSDARMSGCAMPVIINSGSGNQGLTVSMPVVIYARALGSGEEQMYRALALSNLVSIYVKSFIGRLSAFCGAVSAACGSSAAVTWLQGGDYQQCCDAITNTLAVSGGIICDGAKPSCAAKISTALDSAFQGATLALQGEVFQSEEGLVKGDIEATIRAFGRMASSGMKDTDREILRIMLDD